MSRKNWTPGPWFVATGCSWRRILQERTDELVIVPTKSQHDGHPDLMGGGANLQLAAAAPDLYEALKSLLSDYEDAYQEWSEDVREEKTPYIIEAQAALAKARGEDI